MSKEIYEDDVFDLEEVRTISLEELTKKDFDRNIDVNEQYAKLLFQVEQSVNIALVQASAGEISALMVLERMFNTKLKTINSIAEYQQSLMVEEPEENEDDIVSQEAYTESLRKKRKKDNEEKYGISYGEGGDK